MKRLRRIAWNGLAALSGILFLATAAIWVESRWCSEGFKYRRNAYHTGVFTDFECSAGSCKRGIDLGYFNNRRHVVDFVGGRPSEGISREFKHDRQAPVDHIREDSFIGFSYYQEHDEQFGGPGYPLRLLTVTVPYWFWLLLFAASPLIWLRSGRKDDGAVRCESCGYDLRATPERCPECGRPVARK